MNEGDVRYRVDAHLFTERSAGWEVWTDESVRSFTSESFDKALELAEYCLSHNSHYQNHLSYHKEEAKPTLSWVSEDINSSGLTKVEQEDKIKATRRAEYERLKEEFEG